MTGREGGRPTLVEGPTVMHRDDISDPRRTPALDPAAEARAHRSKLIDVGKRLSRIRGALQDRGLAELAASVAESQDGLAWVVGELTEALARVAEEVGHVER